MSVKIYGGTYLGGMPVMDYSIQINGVRVSMTSDDFNELVNQLSEKLSDDLKQAIEVKTKYLKNVKQIQELRKDIISVFFDGDVEDMDSFFFKKDCKEIDQQKLSNILDKHNKFLGFE